MRFRPLELAPDDADIYSAIAMSIFKAEICLLLAPYIRHIRPTSFLFLLEIARRRPSL